MKNKTSPHRRSPARTALLCAGLAAPFLPAAWSQTAPAAKPAADDTVVLPQFTISEKSDNPYLSSKALSASRIALDIQDVPQTISVVSGEFMTDSMSFRMLDAAKYVTPVVESTLPFGGDRYMIRGFQVSQEFIDGSVISGADGYSMSQAGYNIERIEVIKGPNAILVPGGSPGGVMNPITKSPIGKNQQSVTLELGQYNGNALSFDVNRVLSEDGTIAARLVAAVWKNDLYIHNQYRNGYEVSPSISVQLSDAHKLVVKADFVQNRETNLGGVPIDPTVGSDGYARIAPGLPRNWSFGDHSDSRHRSSDRLSAELLSTLGDHVTSRLYVMADSVRRIDVGSTSAALSAGGGSRNPYTGKWDVGVNWNTGAWQGDTTGTVVLTGTSVPVTAPTAWTFSTSNGKVDLEYTEAHIKNDYAIHFEGPSWKSNTVAGYAANTSKVHFLSYQAIPRFSGATLATLNSITYAPYIFPTPATWNTGTDKTAKQHDLQFYVFENFSAWQDRIQLSGGLSRFYGELTRVDTTGTQPGANVPSYNLTDTAKSLGLVVKPIKEVSLFYGYNTSGGTMPGSLSAGNNPATLRVASGNQKEFGVKTSLLEGKLKASLSHFTIVQQNYPIPNSEYYVLVAQGRTAEAAALQNPLYMNLNSKGWEAELTYAVNNNFTLLANATDFKMRQPITNARVRAVPDQAYALYGDYRFTEGALSGFGINIGVDHKDDVAGDAVTGYTATRVLPTGPAVVVAQPSFLVAGRTLTNVGFSYRLPQWTFRLTITNALDKDYILAAGSRGSVVVGEPRAWKFSSTYKF